MSSSEHRRSQCREAARRYQARHPERIKERSRKFRQDHLFECREYDKLYHRKFRAKKPQNEKATKRRFYQRHPFTATWSHMKARCLRKTHPRYKDYGARGIAIFTPWIASYACFETYLLENLGPRPKGMSLDRIQNDQGYFPDNLKWSTPSEQNRNRRKWRT